MGFLDDFLGGGDTEVKYMDMLDPQQRALFSKLIGLVTGEVGKGVEPYPGTRVPGISPFLERYFSDLEGYGRGPLYTGGAGVLEKAMQPYSPEADKEYWEKTFYDPTMRKFQLDVVPQLKEDLAGMGGYRSGGAQNYMQRAYGDVTTGLTGQLANILQTGRESALNRSMQAAGMAPGYEAGPLGMYQQAGLLQREMGREPLEEQYQKWAMSQPWANPWLQYTMPLIGTRSQQAYLEQDQPWYGQIGQSLLGGLQTGLGLGVGSFLGGPSGFASWMGGGGNAANQNMYYGMDPRFWKPENMYGAW